VNLLPMIDESFERFDCGLLMYPPCSGGCVNHFDAWNAKCADAAGGDLDSRGPRGESGKQAARRGR
jgi:hypothetical protein